MNKLRSLLLIAAWSASAATLSPPPLSFAATVCDPGVAKMVSVQGNVEVRRAGQTQSQPARLNETYCAGDRIQVGDKSRADIALVNQPVLRLDQNTIITLAGLKDERASIIDMARGALHFFSRLPRNLEVNTAFVNAGVEGTEGLVQVEADRTLITIFDGKVLAANAAGSLALAAGQSAVAVQGQAPVFRTVVRPRDAVQWALYYPPVTYFRPEDFQGTQPWQGMARNSIEASMKGDYQRAFDALKGAPADITEPRFFTYRASLLLGVGRVDEAGPDLERALRLNPNYSDALALQAIIAVVQNDKDKALGIAQKAVAANPKSAGALTALSYAQQATFDLEGARNSLQQAVQADPNNALAWARLAELHLSFAELDDALEAAQKAVALNPNLSRTQMVLGFAYLTQVDTVESKKAFEKAIELDQADALSRLGLGLGKIRDGDLADGRKDLEIAASLDANNSIVRSYLGKAYYEERRSDLAERDYATAKQLDPKDPTPYFYDAIQKQTTNRPVEALQDMEKAIELNDNRAIYRSRLQLDSDLAARSASQARIYSDLGFQQLALVEGWKSVNTDSTNFSAHRFLADSYSILPRHEIARVSELLQSQLLQPLNMTAIQPHLGEANLFLVSAGGPGTLSFNEFNPLFNRDGISLQASGLAGERNTYSGEGVISGIYKKASFSLGGFRFQTNGWRTNADQKDDIANAFVQFELSPKTSLQFEYRFRNRTTGDLQLNFFRDDILSNLKTALETDTYRAGVRHAFSPNSILLGSFTYQRQDESSHDAQPPFVTAIDVKEPGIRSISGEIQHLFRSQYVNITSGVGHFNLSRDQVRAFAASFPIPFPPFSFDVNFNETVNLDAKHSNVYLYSYINAIKNVTFTLGASGDFFRTADRTASESKNQFNPKFGVTWNILPNTTFRAAAFRAFKRTLITNQTLEPTQVAGFNQFYDDIESTESRRYGVAVDQKFSQTLFGGLEFSKRDLKVPIPFTDPFTAVSSVVRKDWRETLARPYLFWTPHNWVALSAEYQYEHFQRGSNLNFGLQEATTHRVPLGLRFFHPSGLSLALKTTFVDQDGNFTPRNGACCLAGRSEFWLVDAGLSYRLPNRYGFVTVGATNLLDRKFKYQETDFNNPTIQPARAAFVRLTLQLP
jgi:tetratricopeptide (TPR) repeat protein